MLQAQLFINMDELKNSRPLHDYIMHFLSEHGILGATSFRGHSGFGKNHQIKRPSELFSFDEPPMLITFIDEDTKVRDVIAALRKEIPNAFITIHGAEMI